MTKINLVLNQTQYVVGVEFKLRSETSPDPIFERFEFARIRSVYFGSERIEDNDYHVNMHVKKAIEKQRNQVLLNFRDHFNVNFCSNVTDDQLTCLYRDSIILHILDTKYDDCQSPDAPVNGYVQSSNGTDGRNAVYKCNNGYQLSADSSGTNFCPFYGDWNYAKRPTCDQLKPSTSSSSPETDNGSEDTIRLSSKTVNYIIGGTVVILLALITAIVGLVIFYLKAKNRTLQTGQSVYYRPPKYHETNNTIRPATYLDLTMYQEIPDTYQALRYSAIGSRPASYVQIMANSENDYHQCQRVIIPMNM